MPRPLTVQNVLTFLPLRGNERAVHPPTPIQFPGFRFPHTPLCGEPSELTMPWNDFNNPARDDDVKPGHDRGDDARSGVHGRPSRRQGGV